MAGSHRQKLIPMLEPVEKKIEEVERSLAVLGARIQELTDKRVSVDMNIDDIIQHIHETVEMRRSVLREKLDKVVRAKAKAIATEKDMKETMHARLTTCARSMKEALFQKSDTEMLTAEKSLEKQVQEATLDFLEQPEVVEVSTEADMLLSVPPDVIQNLQNFGSILSSPDSLEPMKCTIRGEGLVMAFINEKTVLHLTAMNYKGQPCDEPITSLECLLICEQNGSRIKCEVENMYRSLYQITYTPTIKGRHQLSIVVEGQHVRGSPFTVMVKRSLEGIGVPSLVIRDVQGAWMACVNRKGELLVSECNSHKISVFAPSGHKIREIGSVGSEPGQLIYPRGIALDVDGNIYVVDSRNHRIQKFSAHGRYLMSAGSKGTGPTEFVDPKGMAFNLVNGKLYVADVHRIQILNANLTFSGSFGRKGTGRGEFESAFSVVCDNVGNLYISDKKNNNIQIFASNGQFLRMFSSQVSGAPRVFRRSLWRATGVSEPTGLAVDDLGMVYVSESASSQVSIFTPEGQCMYSFGKDGSAHGEFKWPRGIAVTSDGDLWVCDFKNDRVQVF